MARTQKKVSVRTIAREAGVSVATVSRVLNQRTGVSDEQRSRIGALLKKHQFTVDYSVVRPPKIAIVVYTRNVLNAYVCKIISGVYTYANDHAFEVVIIIADRGEERIRDQIRDQQCAGAIVILAPERKDGFWELAATGFPVIFMDEQVDYPCTGFIDSNSYSGSYEAAEYLIGLGHRKIGYLQYNEPKLNQIQRYNGYKNALQKAGIEPVPEFTVSLASRFTSKSPELRGYEGMLKLLERSPEITAVMAADDLVAHGALCAIHEKGLRVPEDISIIGFDNYPETQFYTPPLTTVNHPSLQGGHMAMEAMAQFIAKNGNQELPKQILDTSLVIRKSAGPVRKE